MNKLTETEVTHIISGFSQNLNFSLKEFLEIQLDLYNQDAVEAYLKSMLVAIDNIEEWTRILFVMKRNNMTMDLTLVQDNKP